MVIVYSLKRNALSIIFCIFCICLILFSNANFLAAGNGLYLWATAVVPSLFPFFVATELLSNTSLIPFLGKYLSPIMRPLFGVPGDAAFAFLMGMISGYPVGAKIVTNFKENGICTEEEAERMLAFTNNSGPLFIIGTVGVSLFGNSLIGILLFVTHILACITVGIVLNISSKMKNKKANSYGTYTRNSYYKTYTEKNLVFSSKSNYNRNKKSNNTSVSEKEDNFVTFSSLGEVLGKSIMSAIHTTLLIGGFVVIFSVVLSILSQSHVLDYCSNILSPILSILHIPTDFASPILSGIIELTNGVNLVSNVNIKTISINIVICAFLLGFGGLSVLLQVLSIISKSHISIRKYFIGKLLQGVFATCYTLLALEFIPIFQFNL